MDLLCTGRAELWKIAKFGFVGSISIVIYFLVVFAMRPIFGAAWLVVLLAYLVTMSLNYFLQRTFTFRSQSHKLVSGRRYVVSHGVTLTINSALSFLVVDVTAMNLYVAQMLIITIVAITSFLICRFWVYVQ
jgi:putative flippase GtrA